LLTLVSTLPTKFDETRFDEEELQKIGDNAFSNLTESLQNLWLKLLNGGISVHFYISDWV
jgi:hypothetical protein